MVVLVGTVRLVLQRCERITVASGLLPLLAQLPVFLGSYHLRQPSPVNDPERRDVRT